MRHRREQQVPHSVSGESPVQSTSQIAPEVLVQELTAAREEIDRLRRQLTERALGLQDADHDRMRFLAMLCHELRTPLTPVLTWAAMLEQDTGLSADVRSAATMMRRNIEMEARLIDDLVDISRIRTGKLTMEMGTIDLHEAVQSAIDVCADDFRQRGVEWSVHLDASEHFVHGDAARLQQVFWNLLRNALKFTDAGGHVSVRSTNPAPDRVIVAVQDTGLGIEKRMLGRIFEAFEQVERAGKGRGGLGLGLAISRSLVDAHEGVLSVESAGVGHGSTFSLSLPTTRRPAPRREVGSIILPGRQEQPKLRILLVEDHLDTLNVLARLLRASGHEVTTADDAASAQVAFSSSSVDLVICDLGLPDGNGLDLMRRMQSARPVRAIALTGFGMEDDLHNSREAGFNAHLTKPVNFEKLLSTIQETMLHS